MSVILAIAGFAAEAKCDHLGYPGGGVTLTLEPYCLGEADLEKRDRIRRWNQRTLLKDIQ